MAAAARESGTSSSAGQYTVTVHGALSDNYMYLIGDPATGEAAVVDPVEADKVVAAARACGLTITTCLTTHHHFDHCGGNNDLKGLCPNISICGGDPSVQGLTRKVVDGEVIKVGSLQFRAVHTPSHTSGHMSYLLLGSRASIFTGDALFVGGCGRFFEGGPEDMLMGARKLAALPPETLLYCGHEYTVKNLQFALSVEPDNRAAQEKILWAQEQRGANQTTVPSTIGGELSFNPFMRTAEAAVCAKMGATSAVDCMRRLRNAKDSFAGSSRPWIPGGGPFPGL